MVGACARASQYRAGDDLWGTLATQSGDGATDARWAWALACVGIVLALAVFMIDTWRALLDGRDAVLQVLPNDVQLAAVLGGLAADGVTGASSGGLLTRDEVCIPAALTPHLNRGYVQGYLA